MFDNLKKTLVADIREAAHKSIDTFFDNLDKLEKELDKTVSTKPVEKEVKVEKASVVDEKHERAVKYYEEKKLREKIVNFYEKLRDWGTFKHNPEDIARTLLDYNCPGEWSFDNKYGFIVKTSKVGQVYVNNVYNVYLVINGKWERLDKDIHTLMPEGKDRTWLIQAVQMMHKCKMEDMSEYFSLNNIKKK